MALCPAHHAKGTRRREPGSLSCTSRERNRGEPSWQATLHAMLSIVSQTHARADVTLSNIHGSSHIMQAPASRWPGDSMGPCTTQHQCAWGTHSAHGTSAPLKSTGESGALKSRMRESTDRSKTAMQGSRIQVGRHCKDTGAESARGGREGRGAALTTCGGVLTTCGHGGLQSSPYCTSGPARQAHCHLSDSPARTGAASPFCDAKCN